MMPNMLKSLVISIIFAVCACTHTPSSSELGIQDVYRGFIPARTAVMPCQIWPQQALYLHQAPTLPALLRQSKICQSFDSFVISGFKNQPYMNGFSPAAIRKRLNAKGQSNLLKSFPDHWRRHPDDCLEQCADGPTYYLKNISSRPEWLLWLQNFSQALSQADAILLPLIEFADEQKLNDRGLAIARRRAMVKLFLIDTQNGQLIWTGGHATSHSEKKLLTRMITTDDVSYPAWDIIFNKLFTPSIWRQYPGRLHNESS